uniref:TIL domain containing protein n=1 Tax=Rhipicephalus appendiculatus TaxID=34631 RepID=A0A131YE91_RHIAP
MTRKLICLFILALLFTVSEGQRRRFLRRPRFRIRYWTGLPPSPSSESEIACPGHCPWDANWGDWCGNGCVCLPETSQGPRLVCA